MLLEGRPAPGLPFLSQLHWVVAADPASEMGVAKLIVAVSGTSGAEQLWRFASPYRGLAAMEEKDSDYFFGRENETVEVLKAIAAAPNQLPVLLGNSGVGKSSLAQAGVQAALRRQAWPDRAIGVGIWPVAFRQSRGWCFLTLTPGVDPLRALVESFIQVWQFDPTDPRRERRRAEWIENLRDGRNTLSGLLDATEGRLQECGQARPSGVFLYIDQGEELYVRSDERQSRQFSQWIADGLGDPRLVALMSMRSDFLGNLQIDEPLYKAHCQVNVPPLREAELREVESRPAAMLFARFESEGLIDIITRRTAEDSAKDAGALPLLSYTLDDMWTKMVQRGDAVLRLPIEAFEPGGVLADRANAFLMTHPAAGQSLRRILLSTWRPSAKTAKRRGAAHSAPSSPTTNGGW
jgi:hypothetical protein